MPCVPHNETASSERRSENCTACSKFSAASNHRGGAIAAMMQITIGDACRV
jgi:hypothetical protein